MAWSEDAKADLWRHTDQLCCAFRAVQLQLESASEERLESTIWLQNKRYSLQTLQNDRQRVYESVWIYSWSFFRVWVSRVADVGGSRTCWP